MDIEIVIQETSPIQIQTVEQPVILQPQEQTTTLEDLTDVAITAPTDGQVLVRSNGEWVNQAFTAGDINLEHIQGIASDIWTIVHNLNKYPSVTIVDSANDEVEGNVRHISRNQLTVTFSAAFSGRAFLN